MLTERVTVRFTPEAMAQLRTAAEQLREVVDPDTGRTRPALVSDIVRWAVDEFARGRITEPLFSDPIGGQA